MNDDVGPCAGALDFKFVEALTEQAKQAAFHIAALIKSIEESVA